MMERCSKMQEMRVKSRRTAGNWEKCIRRRTAGELKDAEMERRISWQKITYGQKI